MINNISEVNENNVILEITYPTTVLLETETLVEMPHSIYINDHCNEHMKETIEISYSFDGNNYSKWFLFRKEQDEFNNALREDYIKGYEIKIQFKVTCEIEDNGTFDVTKQDNAYYYVINEILINNKVVNIINKGIINTFDISVSNPVGLWNPYDGMQKGLNLYKTISKSMNNVLGHWVYYFKTDPNMDTKNIHLRSYELYQVTDMKKIKVLVPRNKFPSAINVYSEYGIQFPDEFNVHILNEVFETAFGSGSFPKTKDYLYFPLNDIMYEVNAFYKPRTFMEKSIYSELILNKYENDINVQKNEYEEDTFEYMELFDDGTLSIPGYQESQESNPNYMNTELLEAFRLKLHKNLKIVENPLIINGLEIFKNEYLFTGVLNNEMSLSFNALDTKFDNITFSGWFMFEKTSPSRDLVIIKNHILEPIISLKIRQKKIYVSIKYMDLEYYLESQELNTNTQYGIAFSISNTYSKFKLNIIEIVDSGFVFHTKDLEKDITPIASSLKIIEFFGGPHLVTNIRLDTIFIDSENMKNYMTTVLPDAKTNILFDKAFLPITDEQFTI